nr:hypothetical protein [Tanacetum cinerariifolium]
MEDQPLPADASTTALSPDYVVNSEDEKDPKEDPADYPTDRGDNDDDESSNDDDDDDDPLPAAVSPTVESPGYIADPDPEENPADYPADEGDDDDDDGSSDDDDDDDDVEEEDEDEGEDEEEHPAPANSIPPPPPIHHVTARMSIREPRAIRNLLRGDKVTSGTSALWLVEGKVKGGDGVGKVIGRSGGVPNGGVPDGLASSGGDDTGWGGDTGNGGDTGSSARDADKSRNGEDSHDSRMGVRRQAPSAHEYTYQDFMKCKPLYFKGTKGVVELTQALTWWNSYVTTFGPDVAYAMTWTNLRKKMTDKYCLRGEIKNLEGETKAEEQQLIQPSWKWQCSSESVCG